METSLTESEWHALEKIIREHGTVEVRHVVDMIERQLMIEYCETPESNAA